MGLENLKAILIMLVVRIVYAGTNILYKFVVEDNMDLQVLIVYRMLFASIFMIPTAILIERNKRPKITWRIISYSFLCGLFGVSLSQNLDAEATALTSPTFSSAMANLNPAITLFLALCVRQEKLALGTTAGRLKLVGLFVSIGGAMIFTFYKGSQINLPQTHINLLSKNSHAKALQRQYQVIGLFSALGYCFSNAVWLIIQAKLSREFPYPYTSTALMCLMGALQCALFATCVERKWTQWKLGLNIRLLAVGYTGLLTSGLVGVLITWCVRIKGPLFIAMFSPLTLLIVAIFEYLFLNESLYIGSLLGGVLIIVGLYMILWGRKNESKKLTQPSASQGPRDSVNNPQNSVQGKLEVEIIND